MVFRYLFRKVLSLTLSPMLRTTVFFTEVFHTTVLSTCNLMQDLIDVNNGNTNSETTLLADLARNHNPDFISGNYNACVSASTQTEQQSILSVRNKNSGNTEVIIQDMNSSKKVIIIQKDLPAGKRKKIFHCETCKSETRSRLLRKDESVVQKNSSERSSGKKSYASDSSNMSIENDVSETKIIEYSQNDLLPKSVSECNSSRIRSNSNHNSEFTRKSSRISIEKSQSEIPRVFELPAIESLDEEDSDSHKQKTSSPVEQFEEQARINYWNTFPRNGLTNENITSFSELHPDTKNGKENNPSICENFSVPGKKFKRRLSLPLEFNKSNEGLANVKMLRDKTFGDVSSSSKSKKTSAYLKFPTSLEACAANRLGGDDSKEGILSSSSYESLPVSDHLQTVVEKNSLTYCKSFTDDVSSIFSSVDELVETFQSIKDELTASKIVQNEISDDYCLSNASKPEEIVKKLNQESPDFFLSNELEREQCEISAFEMQGGNLDKQISSQTLSDCDETAIPGINTDSKSQSEKLQIHRVLSNDSAISSPDSSSSVQELIETTLNKVIELVDVD